VRRTCALRCVIAATTILAGLAGTVAPASATATGPVAGAVFDDVDRDGVRDADESPFAGRALQLVTPDGAWIAGGLTDSDGRYSFPGIADGSYVLRMGRSDWLALRPSHVPTTTGTIAFQQPVVASSGATADLGLRAIVRSTTLGAPISSTRTATGTLVESYNDAVSASEVAAALAAGTLRGDEAAATTVRLDLQDRSFCSSSYAGAPGAFSDFRASVWLDWLSWVDSGDQVLFHEYGHAWAEYQDHIVQQDGTLATYLAARGLTGDSRLGSTVYWDPREMIAEDYRQLFGSASAAAYPQANKDIPAATQVVGLRDFLQGAFMESASPTPPPPPPPPTPEPDSPPAITGLTMAPAPMSTSGTASFTLSEDATVSVRIASSDGATVRTLLQPASRPAGTLSIVWDRLTDQGRKAKAGTYLLVVDAVDGAGQAVQAAVEFSVVDLAKRPRR
jgi:hypothetical protein